MKLSFYLSFILLAVTRMEESDFKKNFKIFSIIFVIILTISTSMLMWMERNDDITMLEETKIKEQWAVQMESSLIYTRLTPLLSDIAYLHDVYKEPLDNPENFDRIAREWMIFSSKRHIYDQIRFIDANGDEKIRIDLKDDRAIRIPDSELQNKKDRYYYYEAVTLSDGSVHISPLDLNIEHDAVEIPYKPMIRLGMPVYQQNGKLEGLIVVNYLANDFLSLFKRYDQTTLGHIMLLNDKSYYLSSQNEDKEWGFMFPDKKDVSFTKDHHAEWREIKQGAHNIISEDGMFTALALHPYSISFRTNSNPTLPRSIYSSDDWYVVSWIPKEPANGFLYYNDIGHLFFSIAGKLVFPILILITIIIAWFTSIGLQYYQKIHYRAEYDPLTKAFSRHGGMIRLKSLFRNTQLSGSNFSICFVDVNGLKEINDKLGHSFGDEMIKTAVQVMQSEIRHDDYVIRYGGDEFIIVLSYVTTAQAENIWNRIKKSTDVINQTENRPYLVSLSHGIVDCQTNQSLSLDELIELADQKMYAEKQIIKAHFCSVRSQDNE